MTLRLSETEFKKLAVRRAVENYAKTKFKPRKKESIFDSKLEQGFSQFGKVLLENFFDCKLERLLYHPMTLHLPGNKYTPDFMAIMSNGVTCFIETKGSKKSKNYRDSRSKLRAAATSFPFWVFIQATGNSALGLTLEEIKP